MYRHTSTILHTNKGLEFHLPKLKQKTARVASTSQEHVIYQVTPWKMNQINAVKIVNSSKRLNDLTEVWSKKYK